MDDELQKAREHVAMLEAKEARAAKREKLQRELAALDEEERSAGKPAQPAPKPLNG